MTIDEAKRAERLRGGSRQRYGTEKRAKAELARRSELRRRNRRLAAIGYAPCTRDDHLCGAPGAGPCAHPLVDDAEGRS